MKSYTPKAFETVKKMQPISFYLWAVCMMVLIGSTIHTIMMQENSNFVMEAIMIAGALIICIVQFALGRRLGTKFGDMVAGRQMMGQKNTGIAIWLAMAYLTPMSTVAPTAYIIWQNLMNSYEIWKDSRKK
jgi:BASS family bile acid:Na+ symporter